MYYISANTPNGLGLARKCKRLSTSPEQISTLLRVLSGWFGPGQDRATGLDRCLPG